MKKITIAIDGLSGCGKSTTAIGAAQELAYIYVDSGAMYRAVTLFFIRNKVSLKDDAQVSEYLTKINLGFVYNREKKRSEIYLNDENVEKQIRKMDVSNLVSEVSRISVVRKKMVAQQRQLGKNGGIVMDGRDIGTNVFPNAELKIFVTADPNVRAERRLKELKSKGIKTTLEEVWDNLSKRDEIDQNRKDDPLRQAKDALLMDTSNMSIEEQINFVVEKAREKIDQ